MSMISLLNDLELCTAHRCANRRDHEPQRGSAKAQPLRKCGRPNSYVVSTQLLKEEVRYGNGPKRAIACPNGPKCASGPALLPQLLGGLEPFELQGLYLVLEVGDLLLHGGEHQVVGLVGLGHLQLLLLDLTLQGADLLLARGHELAQLALLAAGKRRGRALRGLPERRLPERPRLRRRLRGGGLAFPGAAIAASRSASLVSSRYSSTPRGRWRTLPSMRAN